MLLSAAVSRPEFEGMGTTSKVVFYLLALAATAAFAVGTWRRVAKYRAGRPVSRPVRSRHDVAMRWHDVARGVTVARGQRAVGIAHLAIFWGFLTALAATAVLTVDTDLVRNVSRLLVGHEVSFFHGGFFLVYTFAVDVMGAAFLAGLGYMVVRRALLRPWRLRYDRVDRAADQYSRRAMVEGDWLFLGLLTLILLTAYLLTGLRILGQRMAWFTVYSPFGRLVAEALSGLGVTSHQAVVVHGVVWWIHSSLALAFVAYVPYSKAVHLLVDGPNVAAATPATTRRLPDPPSEHPGYRSVTDFTGKELLGFDACTKCGRCHEVCPARAGGAPLSPRDVILDLRQWADRATGGVALLDRERRLDGSGPVAGADVRPAGGVIDAATLWSCTSCMHCVEVCPVGVEHVGTIVQLRRSLVDEGTMDGSLQQSLQNLATQGNSFGKSARTRARWTRELDFTIPDARTQPVKYLWFVGDFASFDDRLQENSRILARILHDAGVDFGLLYDAERNAGNDVRRVGEEGLFELLSAHNVEALAGARFEEIFTTDPHSLNALRHEYPALGAHYRVRHYTELLADLLEAGSVEVHPLGHRVTYHDPCYLARYNGVTDAPRRLLAALGCELVEMPRHGVDTFCCGAGGGRIWMDDSVFAERPSELRIAEALDLGVDQFIVACPKDVAMFSDAVKTVGAQDQLRVRDVTVLVAEALGLATATP